MNIKSLLFAFSILLCTMVCAQVTTDPTSIANGYKGQIIVTFNPNQGSKGMVGATKCFAHTGLITSESKDDSDWKYCFMSWRDENSKTKMTKNQDGTWQLVIDNMYDYYGCPTNKEIKKLAFVFNDGKSGSKEGKASGNGNIYVTVQKGVVSLATQIDMRDGSYVEQDVPYSVTCSTNQSATISLYVDGDLKATQTGIRLTDTVVFPTLGKHVVKVVSNTDTEKDSISISINAVAASVQEKRPAGLQMGVTYDPTNTRRVTLCTYAAGCRNANDTSVLDPAVSVYVIGDFKNNKWTKDEQYRMKRDGNYFWLTIDGLTDGREYNYQYLVTRSDGTTKRISDLYAHKVKASVSGSDGYAACFQTNQSPYQWSDATLNFVRPNKNNLIIYELWVYDHTSQHNLAGLMNRLDYFTELGVNCIELMPVNEFDGDCSWGYSPNHYFAIDKQYGTPNDLKLFVDSCHGRGIAVVLDMVLNHSTGNNPMNKLYPYGDDLKYNPWFNVEAPHGDNVYEDWNHDFSPTHQMMRDVLAYWMDEYKVDGYRLDLSHGLCGKSYNAVANLKDYYNKVVKPRGGYMMLEHWGSNMSSDRTNLVNAGMMCWENTSQSFMQIAEGWLNNGDALTNASKDNYVSYSENHDEERTMAAARMWGNGDNLKTSEAARAARVPAILGLQCMLNGPQLFYHYAEQGFEIAKFQNASGRYGKNDSDVCAYSKTSCDGSNYKMNPKNPYLYKWTSDTAIHMQAMRQVSKIIRLRTRLIPEVFEGNPTSTTLSSGQKLRKVTWGTNVAVAANVSSSQEQTFYPTTTTTWYDYLAGGTAAQSSYTLQPGEIVVLTGKPLSPTPTAMPETTASKAARAGVHKVLQDGQLLIYHDNHAYTLIGTRHH